MAQWIFSGVLVMFMALLLITITFVSFRSHKRHMHACQQDVLAKIRNGQYTILRHLSESSPVRV